MTELHNEKVLKVPRLDMEKWRAIVSDWESSQESQKKYCERLGIRLDTFTYARGKLNKTKKTKHTLIPVRVTPPETQNFIVADIIVIESPQGFKLHVSSALSLDRLSKVFNLCGWLNVETTR